MQEPTETVHVVANYVELSMLRINAHGCFTDGHRYVLYTVAVLNLPSEKNPPITIAVTEGREHRVQSSMVMATTGTEKDLRELSLSPIAVAVTYEYLYGLIRCCGATVRSRISSSSSGMTPEQLRSPYDVETSWT
eukprot:5583866-Amphidinium_carterae.1